MTIKIIYKITYPNGKIYIGSDITNDINYFGSPSKELIEKDFTPEQRKKWTVTREVIWKSEIATNSEVLIREKELIVFNQSNNPKIGYNQTPKFKVYN